MTLAPKPGDEATAASGLLCVYDPSSPGLRRAGAWNRLTEVYEDDGGTSGELDGTDTQILACEYDGLNRRIVREGTETWDFYYNTFWQVVERQCGQRRMEYVWDLRYIDAPVCRWYKGKFSSGGFSHLHYYTNDANMNPPSPFGFGGTGVTALVNADDGDVDERYSYDPYGKVAVRDGDWSLDDDNASDWANEILYCGYRQDPDTGAAGQGMYHVRHRPYLPPLGRWMVRDPKDQDTPGGGYHDGMSLYEYVGTKPVGVVDGLGLDARVVDMTALVDAHPQYAQWVRQVFGGEWLSDLQAELLRNEHNTSTGCCVLHGTLTDSSDGSGVEATVGVDVAYGEGEGATSLNEACSYCNLWKIGNGKVQEYHAVRSESNPCDCGVRMLRVGTKWEQGRLTNPTQIGHTWIEGDLGGYGWGGLGIHAVGWGENDPDYEFPVERRFSGTLLHGSRKPCKDATCEDIGECVEVAATHYVTTHEFRMPTGFELWWAGELGTANPTKGVLCTHFAHYIVNACCLSSDIGYHLPID